MVETKNKKKPNKIKGCLMYTTFFSSELSCYVDT